MVARSRPFSIRPTGDLMGKLQISHWIGLRRLVMQMTETGSEISG
jgi:hypothetical protein